MSLANQNNILIVEDERLVAHDIKITLERMGYEALPPVATGEDALRIAAKLQPALVLMDIHLAGKLDGITTAKELIDEHNIPVIYITAFADEETINQAKETSPYGYIVKPFAEHDLRIAIEIAIHKHAAEKKRLESETRFRQIIEHSGDGIVLANEEGKIIEWNEAQEKISGIPRNEALGQSLIRLIRRVTAVPENQVEKYISKAEKILTSILNQNQNEWDKHQYELKFNHHAGHQADVEIITFPIPTTKGIQIGGFIRDVTARAEVRRILQESEERYRTLYSSMNEGQALHELIYDNAGKPIDYLILDVNPAFEKITGIKKEDAIGRAASLVYKSENAPYINFYSKVALTGEPTTFETLFKPLNMYFKISVFSPQKGQFVTLFSNISARKVAEEANEQHKAEIQTLMMSSRRLNEILGFEETLKIILEQAVKHLRASAGNIIITSSAMPQLFLYQGLSEGTIEELKKYCPLHTKVKRHECLMQKDYPFQHTFDSDTLDHCPPLKDAGYQVVFSIPIRDANTPLGYLYLYRQHHELFTDDAIDFLETLLQQSISAIKKAYLFEKTQYLSVTDSLTQLNNRHQLYLLGKREIERAQRYNLPFSALMIDVDHFKKINDNYGHATGDQTLQELAQQLRNSTREVDILGRYGGEEFAILLPNTEIMAALDLAERLRKRVSKEITLPRLNNQHPLTISIGVASLSEDTPTLDALLDTADTALYEAKRNGRNKVCSL